MNVTIRPATAEDGEALLAIDRACLADGRGMVRAADEHAQDGEAYLTRIGFHRDNAAIFVAEVDGRVIGEGSAKTHPMRPCSHVAMLAVQVHPELQRRGAGRALMRAALDWCRNNGVVRVQLFVRADNARAIALYRSLGFERECVRRRFLRLADGSFADDHCMVLFLDG